MTDLFSRYRRIIITAALLAVVSIIAGVMVSGRSEVSETVEETIAHIDSLTEQEMEEMRREDIIRDAEDEYSRLGIVSVNGYINMRSVPDEIDMTNIIGKLYDGAACEILEINDGWMLVRSGSLTGYVSSEFILEGQEAFEKAYNSIADRVIINVEVLNVRSAPDTSLDNIIGKARAGERYELLDIEGDWAMIRTETELSGDAQGYVKISDGNAEIKSCLDAARKVDLRTMALTQYDSLVLAFPEGGYINIRKEPEDNGIDNICGKFIRGCGAELLETVENSSGTWYRIRSGNVSGYVNAAYCLTGQKARDLAVEYAVLTAFVRVDALNVRSEPSLDAKVWTSVTKNQAYEVLDQLDGWVELGLDSSDGEDANDKAYVSTRDNNVEVRYGLPEAIEYYPAVEAANAAAAFRNSVVNYACQYIGNPYVWGGTSLTSGADCSGFVQSVMKHFGISLPRTSREQAKCGTRITSDKMKPGDLVFYANSSGTINHVGIYIGNGQIVNAASARSGIKISRWNYRTPAAIRNVIGS